ncbi:MAG: cation diffusion facilitator family transporter [Breznakibacter sp.]
MVHHHEHGHGHHHQPHTSEGQRGKKLLWATIVNLSITLVQIAGGLLSNSLSLLSNAIHNLGDSTALFIAFVAGKVSRKQPDARRTFGYKRIEILAALFNAVVLIAICLFLFAEAYKRLLRPTPIQSKLMLIVAVFGLLANLFAVFLLESDKDHNLNVKAAYLHLIGDTLSSVAVIAGGIAIWLFEIYWIDPLITVLVGLYIIWHTWGIVRQTVDILMQSVPDGIDLKRIKTEVEQVKGIDNLHHLHVWKLNDSQTYLEAHLNLTDNINMSEMMSIKAKVEHLLHDKFDIAHVTLQVGYQCCTGKNELIHKES